MSIPPPESEISRVSRDLKSLFSSEAHADVSFILPDGEIQAHKLILVARVPYFEKMFSSGMKESHTSRVEVPDSDTKSFKDLLGFIYSGELPHDFVVETQLALARKYDIPHLVTPCVAKLKQEIVRERDVHRCISNATRMMGECKLPEVEDALEKELIKWIDRESQDVSQDLRHYSRKEDTKRKILKRFIDNVVTLMIFSHLQGCSALIEQCFKYFKTGDENCRLFPEQLSDAKERLKEYPELLEEMVWKWRY